STLYSTFQANNLPSPKSQLNLFLLYMKYYFGSGLEALEVGDLLFLPKVFKDTLNQHNKDVEEVIGANSIKNVKEFLNFLSALSNIKNIDLFFQRIFNKNLNFMIIVKDSKDETFNYYYNMVLYYFLSNNLGEI
ncbi:unnamed protein product, partial [marine sediment metagenome]